MKRTFAVLAVLFLLLRPLCDVLAAESAHAAPESSPHAAVKGESHDGGGEGPCCADIEDGALAKASEKARTTAGPEAMPAAPVLFAVLQPGTTGTLAPDSTLRSRTPASFYLRSARIRR
jgi:hypothetical protein